MPSPWVPRKWKWQTEHHLCHRNPSAALLLPPQPSGSFHSPPEYSSISCTYCPSCDFFRGCILSPDWMGAPYFSHLCSPVPGTGLQRELDTTINGQEVSQMLRGGHLCCPCTLPRTVMWMDTKVKNQLLVSRWLNWTEKRENPKLRSAALSIQS